MELNQAPGSTINFMRYNNLPAAAQLVEGVRMQSVALTASQFDITVAEQGFPGYTINAWNGLLAPAGTPKAIIATLADAIQAACRDAGFNAKFQIHSVETLCTSPETFSERMKADWLMWGDAVKASGVEVQ